MPRKTRLKPTRRDPRAIPPLPHPSWFGPVVGGGAPVPVTEFWERLGL